MAFCQPQSSAQPQYRHRSHNSAGKPRTGDPHNDATERDGPGGPGQWIHDRNSGGLPMTDIIVRMMRTGVNVWDTLTSIMAERKLPKTPGRTFALRDNAHIVSDNAH